MAIHCLNMELEPEFNRLICKFCAILPRYGKAFISLG